MGPGASVLQGAGVLVRSVTGSGRNGVVGFVPLRLALSAVVLLLSGGALIRRWLLDDVAALDVAARINGRRRLLGRRGRQRSGGRGVCGGGEDGSRRRRCPRG